MTQGPIPVDSPDESLERIEASIQEALNRLIEGGRIQDAHRDAATEFRRRLEALQEKIRAGGHEPERAKLPPPEQSHFDLLAFDFRRWLSSIDDEFNGSTKHADGLNG